MKCTNCHMGEYKTTTVAKEITVNDKKVTIPGVQCEKCDACGHVVFSHQQRLEFEKKRLSAESKTKPVLSAEQLKRLRKIFDVSLDEISDMLHIGKNTYGRWERGEVAITPSMNLLVHSLIEKLPEARVNLFKTELSKEIEKAKKVHLKETVSLGEFLRKVREYCHLLPEVVTNSIHVNSKTLDQLENNEIKLENIPPQISANLVLFFNLELDHYWNLLENTLNINLISGKVTRHHARTTSYGQEMAALKSKSINKALEIYYREEGKATEQKQISDQYKSEVAELVKRAKQDEVSAE